MPEQNVVAAYFHACCADAQKGGPRAYESVGEQFFAQTLARECSIAELAELLRLLKAGERMPLVVWLFKHHLAYLKLIPVKKHLEFLRGLFKCTGRLESVVLPRRRRQSAAGAVNYFFADRSIRVAFLPRLVPSLN